MWRDPGLTVLARCACTCDCGWKCAHGRWSFRGRMFRRPVCQSPSKLLLRSIYDIQRIIFGARKSRPKTLRRCQSYGINPHTVHLPLFPRCSLARFALTFGKRRTTGMLPALLPCGEMVARVVPSCFSGMLSTLIPDAPSVTSVPPSLRSTSFCLNMGEASCQQASATRESDEVWRGKPTSEARQLVQMQCHLFS